jgi:hypothetical protein
MESGSQPDSSVLYAVMVGLGISFVALPMVFLALESSHILRPSDGDFWLLFVFLGFLYAAAHVAYFRRRRGKRVSARPFGVVVFVLEVTLLAIIFFTPSSAWLQLLRHFSGRQVIIGAVILQFLVVLAYAVSFFLKK